MQLDFKNHPLLLVGRDPDMLGLLREVLIDAGFAVRAKLLDGFLRALGSEDRPALIIYDESQPELDAERIFYHLQEQAEWSTIPFMLLSDVYHGARIARCLDRGMSEFVDKPFDVDELGGRIRRILRLRVESGAGELSPSADERQGFSGDLAFMGLPDLLMNLHQNMRTGELLVVMEDGEYGFAFSKGKLVYARGPHQSKGRKALFRAIRLFYGRFSFVPEPDETFSPPKMYDYGELPNLVLSAVQESDEYPLTRQKLPPHPILVGLTQQAPDVFSADFRVLRPLLQNPNRECTVDELIVQSNKTDLEAAQEVLRLFEEGILTEV